jgi:hypothetical protein
LESPE